MRTLGRDFWLFQSGQVISIVGDACGNIALAWWILDVTGSAETIATVLACGAAVQTVLTPVFGPLGDRWSRKRLILASDLLRATTMAGVAFLASSGSFSLPAVITLYALFASGTALFISNNLSIVPELVEPGSLQTAVRTTEALQAVGRVAGGVVAGVLVTWTGVGPAFWVDAGSFACAAVATGAILGAVRRSQADGETAAVEPFVVQLRRGFQIIHAVPLLFWLGIGVAVFNLVLSPIQVLLPAYAKLAREMPAWFLGGLEAAMGLGIIVGAATVATLEGRLRRLPSLVAGLVLVGGPIALLPYVPGVFPPMLLMLLLGIGAAWTNIPIATRISVAVPDRFRSRVTSIFAFLFDGTAPIGVALGGVLSATVGVTAAMTALGATVLILLPALFRIPGFSGFFSSSPGELADAFVRMYPETFAQRT